jgi:Uma2 family endonuclease
MQHHYVWSRRLIVPSHAEQHKRFTYGDYLTWPDTERWELIDGVPYDMSPAPARTHQEFVGELFRQIANFLHDKDCRTYVAPFDVRLPKGKESDDAIDTVVQPDIAVVCNLEKLDDAGCRGAPDWVIEVLSPSTAAKDQIQKRDIYECHGVKEYWLVHPTDHTVTVYRLYEGEYGKPEISETKGQLPVNLFEGLVIDWDAAPSNLLESA